MNLTNHFLLSVPYLEDPTFQHSLTYLVEHNEQGALGFIINRATTIDLGEVLRQLDIHIHSGSGIDQPVLEGGPVSQEHGIVLYPSRKDDKHGKNFGHGVSISTSRDTLVEIAEGNGPERFLMLLGYSGWAPGQLEDELARDAWLSCSADFDILFDTELEHRLEQAANRLGINLSNLAPHSGRA